ncbi:MAG: hypothetical protein ACOX8Q_06325 [Christensenellales bacterium]|jgi:hypothetical protein
MTARDVYELALALIDAAQTDSGANTEDYADKAPQIIDVLQRELAFYEDAMLTGRITSLDDVLEISDDTAARVMPYGLAAAFALADKNTDMQSDYSYLYRSMIRTIRTNEADTADEYGVLRGMS